LGVLALADHNVEMGVGSTGPPFRKLGRYTYYSKADMDDWMRARLGPRQRSVKSGAAQEDHGEGRQATARGIEKAKPRSVLATLSAVKSVNP
jgi:hypothetical protein